ncbi:MAG: TfoX/Sxy family protein [Myxococcales bacterium]|nr:TfoX/Sxy family protein [Myxococcales bacterium]
MAWIKIPAEHHAIFRAALPRDARISVVQMFGGLAAMVCGHMMGGLFARSAIARLSPAHLAQAMALDGAAPFDPMGNGRAMRDMVLLPDDVMEEPAELRRWLLLALSHTAGLPPKPARRPAASKTPAPRSVAAAKPARAAKPTAKASRAAKPAAKPARAAKPAAKPARTAKPARAAKPTAKPTRAAGKRRA